MIEASKSVAALSMVLLMGASCSSGPSVARSPDRVIHVVGRQLPSRLQASSSPEVVMLVRFGSEDELERVESEMAERGFILVSRFPCEGDGVAQLRFFGGSTEVLHTTSESVSWHASQILWSSGVPFGWAMSQGDYLFVPAAHAAQARRLLRLDDRTRGRVIGADGALDQDKMLPN